MAGVASNIGKFHVQQAKRLRAETAQKKKKKKMYERFISACENLNFEFMFRIGSETAEPISMKLSGNLRIDLASNPVKFGVDRSIPIFELSHCQIQLLFTMMIFYCWVYMGVDNDLHPLEKRMNTERNKCFNIL
ncbi:jg2744 [Pararge aegeria aegeria]|uniref:Jg2744 protein n=1 Tax=Pararge aegeria aegeria TaxID=348720 RepID=A0A8S4RAF5_9NEOP|nr:jg2744 [Pararge aegeria aegeria]